jgi:hypothetical protein
VWASEGGNVMQDWFCMDCYSVFGECEAIEYYSITRDETSGLFCPMCKGDMLTPVGDDDGGE